jgi:hypothetical protein
MSTPVQRRRTESGYGPIQGSPANGGMPIRLVGRKTTAAMRIGDQVIYHGIVLVLVGHEPMSVPDRRAQVEDPASGERFDVA